jgi:magnesium transporter
MHPPSVPLESSLTARQALEKFQAVLRPGSAMPVSMLFVVGRDGRLLSAVELRDLLAAPPDMRLSELASSIELIKLAPTADQEEAARLFDRFGLAAAPVVDDSDRLVGIVTMDDILQVVQKEASEDIAKLAGTSAEELRSRSVLEVVGLRMPWLLVTVAGGAMVSLIIRHFEATLQQILALASFTPLIAGMGGNVGTQSSMIVVRGLATGELSDARLLPTMGRECLAGMVLGLVYGAAAALAAALLYGGAVPPRFPYVVGSAMWVSMTVAATMGAAVPFALKRAGTDPANATGPFITTSTDILTTLLYLGVATAILL